jgi:hypothetical protein
MGFDIAFVHKNHFKIGARIGMKHSTSEIFKLY